MVGLILLFFYYRNRKIEKEKIKEKQEKIDVTIDSANSYRDSIKQQCDNLIDSVEKQLNQKTESFKRAESDFIEQQEKRKDQLMSEIKSLENSLYDLTQKYNSIQHECSNMEVAEKEKCNVMETEAKNKCEAYDYQIQQQEKKLKRILTQTTKYVDIVEENREQENEYVNESLDSIDYSLDGISFETYFAKLLVSNGFHHVNTTQPSGDYGADVIATKGGIKFAFQCKCYSQSVGNKAVREIYSGMQYYKCHVGVVVTNFGFSKNAITQAESLNVLLWGRQELSNLIREAYRQSKRLERAESSSGINAI